MANKKVDYEEKIIPHSIGFHARQKLFFSTYPNFKVDKFCRVAVDSIIEIIDKKFISQKSVEENDSDRYYKLILKSFMKNGQ